MKNDTEPCGPPVVYVVYDEIGDFTVEDYEAIRQCLRRDHCPLELIEEGRCPSCEERFLGEPDICPFCGRHLP